MQKMSEVFELPLITDEVGDISIGSGDWILFNPSAPEIYGAHIAHAVNHIDKLEEALESVLKTPRGTSGRIILEKEDGDAARAALAAYRGENNLAT